MILWTSDAKPQPLVLGTAPFPGFTDSGDRRYHNEAARSKWGGLDLFRRRARSGWSTAAWRQHRRGGQQG